jgi:hypothetical protein
MARGTFQTHVNMYLAPGLPGGWASANPHVSLLPPSNGDFGAVTNGTWRVGADGVIVGNFAFADPATGDVTSVYAAGTRIGFVQRDQFGLITVYLDGTTEVLFEGQGVTLLAAGDVWVKFAAPAAVGDYVLANMADGSAVASATAADTATAVLTPFRVASAAAAGDIAKISVWG